MNTSFKQYVVVLTTLDEHHHEVEPGFTTKENYHWTQEQEKVPHIYTIHKPITLEDERINLIFSPACDIGWFLHFSPSQL